MLRRTLLFLLAFALLIPPAFSEKVLTNADVVKLTQVGLGDEAIIAKVHQAAEVDFRLDTDDLAKLKNAGVSGPVIAAMLDRSSNAVEGETASAVKLVAGGKTISLNSVAGDASSTYVYVTVLYWMNFPAMHAAVRTTDRSPSFLISTDRDPRSRFYIVSLDADDEDDERSLKMGRSGAFSLKSGTLPDPDWTFPFDAVEEMRGVWKVSPRKSLKPGEYGVYVVQSEELFDFGVD